MQYTCQGPVIGTYTEEEAQALGRPNMAGHNKRGVPAGNGLIVPCGADLTELVEDVDVDGRDHEVTCPRCGNAVSVRRVPGPPDGAQDSAPPPAED
jgi:adenine-specific DNA methylase